MQPHTANRNIKGYEIPKSWGVKLRPDSFYRVTFSELKPATPEQCCLPDEELIRPEFIKMVEGSEADYKNGDFVRCNTKEESDSLFRKIWNNE